MGERTILSNGAALNRDSDIPWAIEAAAREAMEESSDEARGVNPRRNRPHKTTTGVVRDAREIEFEGASSELLRQLEYKAEWHGRRLKIRRGPPKPGPGTGRPRRARRPGSRSTKRESRTRRPKAL